jgi:uncharacterized tellurite resistance protein B-like protein
MSDPQAQRHLAALVAAAFADGRLADVEKRLLYRKASELKIPLDVLSDLMARGEKGQLSVVVPTGREARETLLGELIELVCSDGRVESPEQQILSKLAFQAGVSGPELRDRIRRTMERRGASAAPEPAGIRAPLPFAVPPASGSPAAALPGTPPERPPLPPGPLRAQEPKPLPSGVADIPPVTLQLLRQAISFEGEEGSVQAVERILSVPRDQAERILASLRVAFPELRALPGNSPRSRP